MYASFGEANSRGVLILTRTSEFMVKQHFASPDGRILICDGIINEINVSIVNVYAPNRDEPIFFQNLAKMLENCHENLIVMGDFNLTLNCDLDRLNCSTNNDKAKRVLENIMQIFLLQDIWRVRYPLEQRFSWDKINSSGEQKASRIDLCLISQGLAAKVENVMYIQAPMTDHQAMFLSVKCEKNERGAGYWKMNTRILDKEENVIKLRKVLAGLEEKVFDDPSQKWELIKKEMQSAAKEIQRRAASLKQVTISQLLENITELQSQLPLDRENAILLMKTREDLDILNQEYIQEVMFRTKARWVVEGEKCSRYFLNLERAKYNAKTVQTLICGERELSDDVDILSEEREFYQHLYSRDETVSFTLQNDSGIRVCDETKVAHEKMFSAAEVKNAVMSLNKGKTPGPDGLPAELYQKLWPDIECAFMDMMEHVYKNQRCFETGLQGILNLIPKSGKDTRYLKNLRPITLLNTDYKILEKCIAGRLKTVTEQVIHTDQKGFMAKRHISANIRKILDIMSFCEDNNEEGLLLSMDAEKAFDKLAFPAIFGSLRYFNVSEYLIKWVEILYTGFSIRIQNNGKFSEEIMVERGVHQGGVCSTMIFILAMELISIDIRANNKILGIQVGEVINILNQFADDTDLTLQNQKGCVQEVLNTFQFFQGQTGLKINYNKTAMYRLGSLKKSKAKMYTIPEVTWIDGSDSVKVLGIHVTHEEDKILELNYGKAVDKALTVLEQWSRRSLSLMGKVVVINSLVVPLFVYPIRIQNNGKFSEEIMVERGVHQGGVCSTMIFILAMELISIDIRANNKILGIQVGEVINILNQFADDTDLTLQNQKGCVQEVLNTFQFFQGQTGLKINYNKTAMYRLGSLKKSKAKMYTIPEVTWIDGSDSVKVLGIHVTHEEDKILELNYGKAVDKALTVLEQWSRRSLSLMGKVVVINSLVVPLFVYPIRIQNNGKFSEEIMVERGVHQGGVCSTMIFILAMELISIDIRANNKILGIQVGEVINILNQFADDTDLTLQNQKGCVQEVLNTFQFFQGQTGLKINYNKTAMYRLGSLKKSKAKMYTIPEVTWIDGSDSVKVLGIHVTHEEDKILELNYGKAVDKALTVLEQWSRRSLSLMGKVVVINSLVVPLFVYPMRVLPHLPRKYVQRLESKFREFLWSGKKAKIGLRTICGKKSEGGLGLVDLRIKDVAIKISWLKLLKCDQHTASIAYGSMGDIVSVLGETIWRCNLHKLDAKRLRINNTFWMEVLEDWCGMNHGLRMEAQNQIIWMNSYIRIQNRPVFWSGPYRRGLLWLGQLFEDGQIITYEQAKRMYGLNFMQTQGLLSAIPKQWRNEMIEATGATTSKTFYDECLEKPKLSSFIYNELITDSGVGIKLWKWAETLNISPDDLSARLHKCFRVIYGCTNVPKLRSFQYRLLHFGLVTNVQLHKWKMREDALCTFCGKEEETITHLFYTCPEVVVFWEGVSLLAAGAAANFAVDTVLLNDVVKSKHIVNFLVLVAKQYIYSCKCGGKVPKLHAFKRKIRYIKNTEKYIASKNNSVHLHYRKWAIGDEGGGDHLLPVTQEDYLEAYISEM